MSCQHEDFVAVVEVTRLHDGETDDDPRADIRSFVAEMSVVCHHCQEPFAFKGLPIGSSHRRPTTDVDATQVRLPLASRAEVELQDMIEAEEGPMLDPPVTLQTALDYEQRALELLPASLRRVQVLGAHPEPGHVTLVLRWRDGMKLSQRRRAEAYLLGELIEQAPINHRLHLESINPQESNR